MKKLLYAIPYNLIVLLFAALVAISTWYAMILVPGSAGAADSYRLAFSLQDWVPKVLQILKLVMGLFWLLFPFAYAARRGEQKGLLEYYRWLLYAHGLSVAIVLIIFSLPLPNRFGFLFYCGQFLLLFCLPISYISPMFALYTRKTVWNPRKTPASKQILLLTAAFFALCQFLFLGMKYYHFLRGSGALGTVTQAVFTQQNSLLWFMELYQNFVIFGLCGIVWFFISVFALKKHGLHWVIKSLVLGIVFTLLVATPIALFVATPDNFSIYALLLFRADNNTAFTSTTCFFLLIRSSVMALLASTAAIATVDGVFHPQPEKNE